MQDQLLTPMMKQYLQVKKQYPDGILLFRAGDFYEMFYDDAKVASEILNITLTKRGKGKTEAPLAGIPYHSVDPYISKLIKHGKKVVICEQIEDPRFAKGVVKRAVSRIITPSSLFTDAYENNFLCSISLINGVYGFSILDITTGDFKVKAMDGIDELLNELTLIKPKELVLTKNILKNSDLIDLIKKTIPNVIINYSENIDVSKSYELLKNHFNLHSLESFGLENRPELIVSAQNALQYLKETQFSDLSYITTITQLNTDKYLKLDRKTARHLELVNNLRDNSVKYTLFHTINNTKTPMGHRKLYFDILHPFSDINFLNMQLDCVDELFNNVFMQQELSNLLVYVGDIDKIISKIGFGNANPRDLIALKQSLFILPQIKQALSKSSSVRLKFIFENLIELNDVVDLLEKAIVEDPPFSVREGKFIKPSFSQELSDIINLHKTINSWLLEYEEKLRQETNIKSLKIKYNKVFGYYIEIPKSQTKTIPDFFERKQTLVNSERYTTKELQDKENTLLNTKEKRVVLEFEIFQSVCKQLLSFQENILNVSKLLADLDVCLSHAITSSLNNYCKPALTENDIIFFKDLRHPVLEKIISFIPNDCYLNNTTQRTMVITGPNMAGKSSYMRSVCLAVILGHIGCFVPSSEAIIGKVDGIFTRVGASDDILHGQSTFLTEMSEVAYILNNATQNSLVVLDEIGRGTSTYDGLSLAWAIVEELNNNIKCKTLVATHYHLLNKMEELYEGVVNYYVTAKEEGNSLLFYHKLQKGGINKSYGIQVAKMAGISNKVIERAMLIQRDLEEDAFLKTDTNVSVKSGDANKKQDLKNVLFKKEQKTIYDY